MRLFSSSPLICLATTLALAASTAHAQTNGSVWLRAPDVVAQAGQTVTVSITLDNLLSDLQGWSFSCNVAAPLSITADAPGATTSAFNSGSGPSFYAATVYPGQGFTTGCVISFFGAETLGVGGGYELHTCDVKIPANATPGTVYPITFDGPALGTPPVATVVVLGGQSIQPTLVAGSITVGTAAAVTQVPGFGCQGPTQGSLTSNSTPQLGGSWTLQVVNTPATTTHAIYLLGTAQTLQSMSPFGSPCTLQVAQDLSSFALAVGGAAQSFTLPIPNSPLLMGVDVYAQGVHDTQPVAPFSGFLGLPVAYYFTNALAGTLGY